MLSSMNTEEKIGAVLAAVLCLGLAAASHVKKSQVTPYSFHTYSHDNPRKPVTDLRLPSFVKGVHVRNNMSASQDHNPITLTTRNYNKNNNININNYNDNNLSSEYYHNKENINIHNVENTLSEMSTGVFKDSGASNNKSFISFLTQNNLDSYQVETRKVIENSWRDKSKYHSNRTDNFVVSRSPETFELKTDFGDKDSKMPINSTSVKHADNCTIPATTGTGQLEEITPIVKSDMSSNARNKIYKMLGPFRFIRQSEFDASTTRRYRQSEFDASTTRRYRQSEFDASTTRRYRKTLMRMRPEEENKKMSRKAAGGVKPIKGLRKGDVKIEQGDYGSVEISTSRPQLKYIPDATIRPRHSSKSKHRKETLTQLNNFTTSGEFSVETSYGKEVSDGSGKTERFKCKSVTRLVTDRDGHKSADSRGISFSEQGDDRKSLICRAETSDTERAHGDILIRKGVSAATIITQEKNPYKLVDTSYQPRGETLEIGSSSQTRLDGNSKKNSSSSFIGTHDKKADSTSRTRSRFVYNSNDPQAVQMESVADISGNTAFDVRSRKPVVMTSSQHDSAMVQQNPNRHVDKSTASPIEKNRDDIKTVVDYHKKSNFEILFRHLNKDGNAK